MQKTSLNFSKGDILILELPFTDLIGKKLRPVLVLSSRKLNEYSNDIIVAKISSSQRIPRYEVKLEQKDLEEGKIKKTSYIHCHSIFAVEKSLVLKKVGKVKKGIIDKINEKMKEIFEL